MTYQEKVRGVIRNTITATVPKAVWTSLRDGIHWAYAEAHDSAENDPRVLDDQARFKAAQDRHFFVEGILHRVAQETGSTFVPGVVGENGWRYGLLRSGKISFTQKCVASSGEIPPPAKFRENLAETNAFIRQGSFAFLKDARAASKSEINGILIHRPESREFDDKGFRIPAFILYAVPLADYSDWAARFEVSEIIASYQMQQTKRKAPAPKWKTRGKKDDGTGK